MRAAAAASLGTHRGNARGAAPALARALRQAEDYRLRRALCAALRSAGGGVIWPEPGKIGEIERK